MAVSHLRNTPITGKSYTTPVDATQGLIERTAQAVNLVHDGREADHSAACRSAITASAGGKVGRRRRD